MQTKTQILQTLFSKKGQFGNVLIERPMKVRKGYNDIPVKKTRMSVRCGLDYDNMTTVKEKRETGELPSQNAGLQNGMEWVAFPYLLKHKEKNKEYLRLYPNWAGKTETTYYLNDKQVQLDEIREMLLASELPKKDDLTKPDCISVSLDNVQELV